jgi:bifunctional DNA-binding transcriptional regulator/antitoxin component of YhaV-PrlF toxin-antitoxin module
MPGKTERRVGTTGKDAASYTLVIPKAWAEGVGVRPGDPLTLVYDDALVVLPPGATEAAAWSLLRTFRRAEERAARSRVPAEVVGVSA